MKAKFNSKLLLVILSVIIIEGTLHGQFLLNPSMEDSLVDNDPPDNWTECGYGSSPDTPPLSSIDIYLSPSDGISYMSMRTRPPSNNDLYDEKIDRCYTPLLRPFIEGNCYVFIVDLATDTEIGYADSEYPNYLEPCFPVKFQIRGFNDTNYVNDHCEQTDLLAESEPISHTDWEEYKFIIYPEKDYHYLMLQAYYATEDSTYHGVILLDNIRIMEGGNDPLPFIVMDTIVPYNTTIELEAFEGFDYSWTPSEGLTCDTCPVTSTNVTENKIYNVLVKHDTTCFTNEEFHLNLEECETVMTVIGIDTNCNIGDVISFEASESRTYAWTPEDNLDCPTCRSFTMIVSQPGEFQCEIMDEHGCVIIERFIIRVEMTIPNVFTPNGDGINDCFVINNLPENSKLQIFDRNGVLLYESDNYRQDWDGRDKNGNRLMQDNYWYMLTVAYSGEKFHGSIYLKR